MIYFAFSLSWLLAIITFLLGYALGKGTLTVTTYQAIKKELSYKILPQYRQQSGVIQRPTAKRLEEIYHPEIAEEREAMKEALGKGVEPLTPVL